MNDIPWNPVILRDESQEKDFSAESFSTPQSNTMIPTTVSDTHESFKQEVENARRVYQDLKARAEKKRKGATKSRYQH